MRKHFLILMLLTLLPLAGWAQSTASFGEITFGVCRYGDTSWPAIQVKDGDGEILTKGTDWETDDKVYSDADCTPGNEVTLGAGVVAGDTRYYVKVTGKTGTVYEGLSKVAYFTVQKCPVTLEFTADCLNRTYGDGPVAVTKDMVSTTVFKYSQTASQVLKGTAPTYTTETVTAGDDKVVTFVESAGSWHADNYEIVYPTDFTLNIAHKAITPTLTVTGTYTYTGAVQAPAYTLTFGTPATDVKSEYELKYSTDNGSTWTAEFKNYVAGGYKVKAVPTATSNYSGESASVNLSIAQQPLTVYVIDFERVYTGAEAVLTGTDISFAYAGLVGADAAKTKPFGDNAYTVEFANSTIDHINVGPYNVQPKEGTLTGNYANYDITLIPAGKVTVTPKAIAIKPTAGQTKEYGNADPVFTVDATTAFTGDQANVAAAYTVVRSDVDDNHVGIHEDVLSLTKKAEADLTDEIKTTLANYTIDATATENFEITGATLYVYPKNVTITYGDADAALVIGTSVPNVTLTSTPTVKFKDIASGYPKNAGTYVLTLEGTAAAEGYTVTLLDGQYTINKKALTPVIATQTIAKSASTPVAADVLDIDKVTFDGLVGNDVIGYTLGFAGSVTNFNEDKTHAAGITIAEDLTVEDNKNANYTIDWTQTGKLIIGNGTNDPIQFVSGATDLARINAKAGETQNVRIYFGPRNGRTLGVTRNWKAGEWSTMVLPFDISVADLSQALGYAIVNVINPGKTVIDGTGSKFYGKLTMTGGNGKDDVLAANKPFLIKLAKDLKVLDGTDPYYYDFGPQTIVAPNDLSVNADDAGTVKFTGTYTAKTVTKTDDAAIWFTTGNPVDDDGTWFYIRTNSTASWTIVPFEAYIDMSALPNEARNMTFYVEELDGSVTAINGITKEVLGTNLNADGWYTLNGVKLQSAPTQKGIYINNGKKIVIK